MNERPIIFSGESVRAILEGRKTQTRRVVKNVTGDSIFWKDGRSFPLPTCDRVRETHWDNGCGVILCPYGRPGDRLWVREAWQLFRDRTPEQQAKIAAWFAKGDHSNFMNEIEEWSPMPDGQIKYCYAADFGDWAYDVDSDMKPWKSSIFMPRAVSRLTLEITTVRVERLQDITEADARAEGVGDEEMVNRVDTDILPTAAMLHEPFENDRVWFAHAWNEINGKKYSWQSNPWVWVIEWSRI